jgi:hypothetical protein
MDGVSVGVRQIPHAEAGPDVGLPIVEPAVELDLGEQARIAAGLRVDGHADHRPHFEGPGLVRPEQNATLHAEERRTERLQRLAFGHVLQVAILTRPPFFAEEAGDHEAHLLGLVRLERSLRGGVLGRLLLEGGLLGCGGSGRSSGLLSVDPRLFGLLFREGILARLSAAAAAACRSASSRASPPLPRPCAPSRGSASFSPIATLPQIFGIQNV